jgi:chaperone required for assembly of F1-ATPase
MTAWRPRVFWSEVTVEPSADGHALRLDGRPVRSPSKAEIAVPSAALAEGMAEEWRAQDEVIDPLSMPLTRAANTTVDKVRPQREAVAAGLAEYGGSDLLCYRAASPEGLVARQAEGWDPMLDWAAARFGGRLAVTQGVIPIPQPANALEPMRAHVLGLDPWEITALSEFVTLSGSLVLGLAALEGARAPDALWSLSRIDEDWQAALWGVDEEAAEAAEAKRAAFLQADRYLRLLRKA